MKEVLVVKDISKTFRITRKQQRISKTDLKKKVAVDHLSFSVYEGEVFGLLGPNGAGKTTTLRIISSIIKPDSGTVYIDNQNVITQSVEVRQKIGFLTSELKLDGFFSPNYLFDFFSDLYGIDAQTREIRKKDLFQKFGIDKFAEVKVENLSTGMKQKTSLAISLVNDPQILIFDEPTNGLDVITAKTVTDLLLDLKKEGKTIIVSTHIFSLVEKICDRVGIILDGQMVHCNSVSAITEEMSIEDKFFEIYKKTGGDQNA